jgi:hypothetical protein
MIFIDRTALFTQCTKVAHVVEAEWPKPSKNIILS